MNGQTGTAVAPRAAWQWARGVALASAIALLAACGGDDKGGGALDQAGDTPAADNTTSGSGSGSGSDSGSGSGSGSGASAKCIEATKAMAAAAAAVPTAMTGTTGNLQQSIDQLEAFANAAPSEIRNDLKTVAAGYAKFAKALKDSGYTAGQTPSPAVILAMQKASAELDKDDFQKASDRVDAWFDKECDS
jgi:hypothetical protein